MTRNSLYGLEKSALRVPKFLMPLRQRNFYQDTAKNTAKDIGKRVHDTFSGNVGNVDLKGLGKWTAGAGAGGGMLAYQGSPTDRPNTYLTSTAASLLAMLATRGRARRFRFPATVGAGFGGMYYGGQKDRNNAIEAAEALRLKTNSRKIRELFDKNVFLHGQPFGVSPNDYRLSRDERKNLKEQQMSDMHASQTERPDYEDYPGLRIPFFNNSGWSE
tara:strand:- start:2788 stop:3438 length:651 start_codon:yes stop_codon:yes gene_type:complete